MESELTSSCANIRTKNDDLTNFHSFMMNNIGILFILQGQSKTFHQSTYFLRMKLLDQIRLIVYRMHEKGIEIFLIDSGLAGDQEAWKFPVADSQPIPQFDAITLEPVTGEDGHVYCAMAIRADYHDIPSIRAILKHDINNVTYKLKEVGAQMEQGKFVILKDALKRVLPEEYKMLKELKDVLIEKNLVSNI